MGTDGTLAADSGGDSNGVGGDCAVDNMERGEDAMTGSWQKVHIPLMERLALADMAERQGKTDEQLLAEIVRDVVRRELAQAETSAAEQPRTCETCKWWENRICALWGWGEAGGGFRENSKAWDKCTTYCIEAPKLVTESDFGCNQWEGKGDAP